MLACVPHEEHELPLMALAAALGEQGVPATVLGARTPAAAGHTAAAWTAARAELTAGAPPSPVTVVLLALVTQHADPALLRDLPPSVRMIAAGPGWEACDVPGRCRARTASPRRCASSSSPDPGANIPAGRTVAYRGARVTPALDRGGTVTETGTTQKAVLAGGCFWGMQDLIRKQPGVVATRVGYTGGENANATYRNHPGHAEAIEITFDPARTSYRDLLEFFFQIHDPSTRNRQGNDVGA